MPDFIPQKDSELIDWLTNFSNKLDTLGIPVGLTAPEIADIKSQIADYHTLHDTTEGLKQTAQASIQNRTTVKTALLAFLRSTIRRFKENAGYSAQIGEDFDVISETSAFDPVTFKTTLTARNVGSDVRIEFTKSQTDGVNVYARLNGQPGWTFLARDTQSPYMDTRPLAVANTPEQREYKARGVVQDAEIGVDSDIVTVVFSG